MWIRSLKNAVQLTASNNRLHNYKPHFPQHGLPHTHALRNLMPHIYLIKVSIWTVTTIIIRFGILRNNIICRNHKRPWPTFMAFTCVNSTYIVPVVPQGVSRSAWRLGRAHVCACHLIAETTTRIRVLPNLCMFGVVFMLANSVPRRSSIHSVFPRSHVRQWRFKYPCV